MRKLLLLAGLALLPVMAWALSLNVSFRLPPLVNKIRPVAVVDEIATPSEEEGAPKALFRPARFYSGSVLLPRASSCCSRERRALLAVMRWV